nr:hypothetical protein [Tanacetum cinerariifolium]
MLEEMVGISLDSMLDKWHRISKGIMHGRMVGFKSGTGNIVAARAEGTGIKNQAMCYNYRGLGHIARNCTARPRRRDVAYLQTQLLIAQKEEAGIQLQAEEFEFMAAADGSAEVHLNDNCYDNEIFNMFTQEEQYMDLLEPIPEPQLVPQNDNHVTYVTPSMVQSGRKHLNMLKRIVKMRFLKKEIKPANYAKINHLSGVFVPQTTKSKEELFLSNISNMVTVSKTISIQNKDLSDDTTPSVARKFLNEEADESLDKQKSLELETERLLKASVSHDIMSIVQNGFVDAPSDLRTELDHCRYEKIFYNKAYNDMQQKVERLQAQLRDLKGMSNDTPSASNTLDPLNPKLESKIVELEFQVVNYEREISHLKNTYKNLFDSIKSNRVHAKLHDLIYEDAQLRAWGFENTFVSMKNTSGMSVTPHVDKPKLSVVTHVSKKLHALMSSPSVPQP